MKPKRRNSRFAKGMVCLGNLRYWLQSPSYFGVTGKAKDTLVGWEIWKRILGGKRQNGKLIFTCLKKIDDAVGKCLLYKLSSQFQFQPPPPKLSDFPRSPLCRIVVIRYQTANESCPSRIGFPGGGRRRVAWLGRGCCLSLDQKEALVQPKGTQLPWHLTDTPSQE